LAGGFFFGGALGFDAGAECGSERDWFDGRVSLDMVPLPCDAGCRSLFELEVFELEVLGLEIVEPEAAGLPSFFAGGVNGRNPLLEFADAFAPDAGGVDGPRASFGDIAGA
jgi:hypothetical protein